MNEYFILIHFTKGFKIENEMWTEMKQTNERSYL